LARGPAPLEVAARGKVLARSRGPHAGQDEQQAARLRLSFMHSAPRLH
jgi:hypothetical protein